ncbi:hypothetical protein AgCh_027744 [Apium graveolens]
MKIELASYQMVIHEIMVFMDTRSAVQTSILSKRWKLVWTTLPYLNFNANDQHYKDFSSFLDHFFSCRNCESRVMKLDFCPGKGLHVRVMKKVSYFTLNLTKGKVVVLAPKLRNFHAIGVFLTRFECSELENVTIQFWDCKFSTPWWTLKQYKDLFKVMFSQLGSTKILTLDSATLQDDLTPPMTSAAPLVTQHGVRSRRLKNIVENNVVNSHKVRQIEAPVAGASNGQVNAMEKSNFVLWQGHEVASEFVGVLDLIMKKYPKTFRNLPKKNEKILTVKLNTFCSLVNTFTKMSMTEVNTEMLAEFGSLFTDLHKWGFNINWLVRHLNYIKKLHELHATDSRIDIAKIKLQEKLTQCAEKLNGSESFQTTGTSHAAMPSFIGNGLLRDKPDMEASAVYALGRVKQEIAEALSIKGA